MSTFSKLVKKCAICGKEHEFIVVNSTTTMGAMDLDTRPPQMKRSTLPHEIQYCDKCHYANDDIENIIEGFNKDSLSSQNYLAVVNDDKIDRTAKAFLLAGHLHAIYGKYREAGIYFLNAAWIFDDLKEEDYAKRARLKSHKYLSVFIEETEDINLAVLTVDLQRRVGDFIGAIETANQLLEYGVDDFLAKILNFEIELSNKNDSSCHSVGEVE